MEATLANQSKVIIVIIAMLSATVLLACDSGRGSNADARGEELVWPTPDWEGNTPIVTDTVDPAFPTPMTAKPTPVPEDTRDEIPTAIPSSTCPVREDICDVASDAATMLKERDIAGIFALVEPTEFVCGEDTATVPACNTLDMMPGDSTSGIPVGKFGGDGAVLTGEEFQEYLRALLEGVTEIKVVSVGCGQVVAKPDCGTSFATALQLTSFGEPAGTLILRLDGGKTVPTIRAATSWIAEGPVVEGGVLQLGSLIRELPTTLIMYQWSPLPGE